MYKSKKYLPAVAGVFLFISALFITGKEIIPAAEINTETSESVKMGGIRLNLIEQDSFHLNANVCFYNDDLDNECVYVYSVSELDDFSHSYQIPYGSYYVAALPAGSAGGGSVYAYSSEYYVEITPDNSPVINVILGEKDFVLENKVLVYETDEYGDCVYTGSCNYEKAEEQSEQVSQKAVQRYEEAQNTIRANNQVSSNKNEYLEPETFEPVKEEREDKYMDFIPKSMQIVIIVLLIVVAIGCRILSVTRKRKTKIIYSPDTLKHATAYRNAMKQKQQDESFIQNPSENNQALNQNSQNWTSEEQETNAKGEWSVHANTDPTQPDNK